MATDIQEAIRRLFYQYKVEGADEVMATQEAVAASTTKTDKASLSLEKAFGSLERRYVETVRHQQDYAKIQDKVNAAVAQNPELQERANTVLAAAAKHFENLASRGNFFADIMVKGFNRFLGPMALVNLAMTGIGAAIGYMAAQWQSSSTTVEQALTETNRLIAEGKKLIDERTSAQDRMFAQSKDQTQFELLQNQVDLQRKLNSEIEQTIALAEKRAGQPSQVPGEMGEAPAGFAPSQAPGYKEIAAAMENLRNAQAAGLPGMREFNAELGRIGQEYPGVAATVQELIKAGQTATGLEQAALKARAISDALGGVATNAQLAAVGLGSIAQFNMNNLKALDAAYALERMANEADRLATIYPNLSLEGAKQVELLDAQLRVAQARTDEERLIAEEIKRQIQLRQQGVAEDEAALIAAKERRIAEEGISKQKEQQKGVTREVGNTNSQLVQSNTLIESAEQNTGGLRRAMDSVAESAESGAEAIYNIGNSILHTLNMLPTQMQEGRQFTYFYDPLRQHMLEQMESMGIVLSGASKGGAGSDFYGEDSFFADAMKKMTDGMSGLTDSTDALNATMQNILSPYYSQDPRTTKLGFRAGVMGNTDWLAPGATNANPLAVILGAGATAPGMANGGSFVVGGGYSANDNRIAAFPVASGEQVTVNRTRQDDGAKVVNIDNRIIINGSVDQDAISQLKVSRYQQAQRMRAGLSQAS